MRNERQVVFERKRDFPDRLGAAAEQIDDSQADRFPERLQLLRAVIRIESIVQRRILRFVRLMCLCRRPDCTRPVGEAGAANLPPTVTCTRARRSVALSIGDDGLTM